MLAAWRMVRFRPGIAHGHGIRNRPRSAHYSCDPHTAGWLNAPDEWSASGPRARLYGLQKIAIELKADRYAREMLNDVVGTK